MSGNTLFALLYYIPTIFTQYLVGSVYFMFLSMIIAGMVTILTTRERIKVLNYRKNKLKLQI